jgi:hypothetical protein
VLCSLSQKKRREEDTGSMFLWFVCQKLATFHQKEEKKNQQEIREGTKNERTQDYESDAPYLSKILSFSFFNRKWPGVIPVEFEDRSISSAPGPPPRTQSRSVDRSLVFVSTDSLSLASSNYKY